MTETPADPPEDARPPETPPEPRLCPRCGGKYDQPPADADIPVCTACLRGLSFPMTSRAR